MTLKELYEILDETFPNKVAYNFFPVGEVPEMPFICLIETRTDNFGADNKVFHKRHNVDIQLYTETKDLTTEQTLEDALDSVPIFYNASDTYLDDEKCYERTYEIEV